jgi:hypothetical protein
MTRLSIPEASPSRASLSPNDLRRSRNNSRAGSVTSAYSHVLGSDAHSYSCTSPLQYKDSETNDRHNAESNDCADEGAVYVFRETLPVASKQLTVIDIVCLILNKMIGTGIFTTPGFILSLTHGKGISLMFWGLGGVYVALW